MNNDDASTLRPYTTEQRAGRHEGSHRCLDYMIRALRDDESRWLIRRTRNDRN
jgi:cbb3-type cytochrome oxidase cytochrome c subunit